MFSNLLEISTLFFFIAVSEACRPGWVQDRETCYYFSVLPTTWIDAGSFCARFGAKLAEPSDQSKIDFLSSAAHNHSAMEYYIGGSDLFVEGQWIWTTTQNTINPTHWNKGEPNNAGPIEDCLLVARDGTWNDEDCFEKYPFICETENEDEVSQSSVIGK